MRNIYRIALFAGLISVSNLTATQPMEGFDLGGTRPKTSALPTDGSQSQFEIQNRNANNIRLKQLESLLLLEKRSAKGFSNGEGITEVLEAMTGTNVIKNKLAETTKNFAKSQEAQRYNKLIVDKLEQRHDIYKDIYSRFGEKPRALPAFSYEDQLNSNLSTLQQIQDSYIKTLRTDTKINQKDVDKLDSYFKSTNWSLENQLTNLLLAIQ